MSNRQVLITGVCGGIGRAAARKFRSEGWSVIGADRAEPDADVDVDRFELVDVSQSAEVAALFARLRDDLDGLNALVNNAATQVNKPIVETSDEDWECIINTNVRSAFQCIREAHPLLKAVRGAVVNVSSVHAIATSMNVAVYAISKGALVALAPSIVHLADNDQSKYTTGQMLVLDGGATIRLSTE